MGESSAEGKRGAKFGALCNRLHWRKYFFAAGEKEGTEKGTQKVQIPCLKDKQPSPNGKIFPMVILPHFTQRHKIICRVTLTRQGTTKQKRPESIEPRKRNRWPKTIEECKRGLSRHPARGGHGVPFRALPWGRGSRGRRRGTPHHTPHTTTEARTTHHTPPAAPRHSSKKIRRHIFQLITAAPGFSFCGQLTTAPHDPRREHRQNTQRQAVIIHCKYREYLQDCYINTYYSIFWRIIYYKIVAN